MSGVGVSDDVWELKWLVIVWRCGTAGLMCGNCFAMKQNRSSNENLQTGGANGLSVSTAVNALAPLRCCVPCAHTLPWLNTKQVRRAVLFINLETNIQGNFDKFGHMASLRLIEIGEV